MRAAESAPTLESEFDSAPTGGNNPAVAQPKHGPGSLTTPALVLLCATIFASVTNASMSSIALPAIATEFDVTADNLTWVVTAFIIPFATGTLVYGRLGDMFGTKRMYLFGLAVFTLASFGAAAANSFGLLILARVVQGMGGTAIPSLSLATIIRTTTPAQRGAAMGATIMTVGLGFATGPILGGWLVELAGWQGPFIGIGIATSLLFPVVVKFVPNVAGTPGQRFDAIGAALVTGAITGAVIALNRLPRDITDSVGLAGLLAAGPLAGLFLLRMRRAAEPFIDRDVAANGRFWALSMIGFTAQGTHFAVIVLIPLVLSRYFDLGTIRIGLYLLPGALAIAFFGMTGGILLNRLGARFLLVGGAIVMLAGTALFHAAGVGWQPAGIAAMYAVIAAGYGMVQAAVITAATGSLPERLAGLGSGAFNLVFFLGGAVSVALSGAILRRRDGAASALDPLFTGNPIAHSDALLVVVIFGIIGLTLALLFAPGRSPPRASPITATTPLPADRDWRARMRGQR